MSLIVPQFDVVIVGAGPAGGYAALLLAKKGYQVLLVEQHPDFSRNNFSSAASPLEILEQFDLPSDVVAAYWHRLAIVTTQQAQKWERSEPLGVVFDFVKLRNYLSEKVVEEKGEVWMGCRYLAHSKTETNTLVKLKKKGGEIIEVSTQILVDATGHARAVMYPDKGQKPPLYKGTGIEYLIEVDQQTYQQYQDTLVFFLGSYWSPKGYGWIFPMDNQQLKVGSAWIDEKHQSIENLKPLRDYTKTIIREYLKVESYRLIEIHGSVVSYAPGLTDLYSRDNLIAIGDAVSTINPLGGEGIRHAMKGAAIAVPHIEAYLTQKKADFQDYEKEMKAYFGKKWNLSEKISRRAYLVYDDDRIDRGVAYLKYLKVDDIMAILFDYEFDKLSGGLYPYLLKKLAYFQQQLKKQFRNIFNR